MRYGFFTACLFMFLLFSGCSSCRGEVPALEDIVVMGESGVFHFPLHGFPDIVSLDMEEAMYSCSAESVTAILRNTVISDEYYISRGHSISIVKYVDGQWRHVVSDQIIPDSIMSVFFSDYFEHFFPFAQSLIPGKYRAIIRNVSIGRRSIEYGMSLPPPFWFGTIWTEFSVVCDCWAVCDE
jgi:hypothetical protein